MPTDNAEDILNANIADAIQSIENLKAYGVVIGQAAKVLTDCFKAGNKLLACGNGGSSADASHIVAEFVGRFVKERRGYPAIALNDAAGTVTAIGNDYGYENVFSRQVEAFGKTGDVLLAISTTGNSPNIVNALNTANNIGLSTISLLGRDGGKCKGLANIELIVNHPTTARVQEGQQLLYHTLCQIVDDAI